MMMLFKKIIIICIYVINIIIINNIIIARSSSSSSSSISGTATSANSIPKKNKGGFVFEGVWPLQSEDTEYEMLYLEFVMASWNLSGTPWNAYHSAIALRPMHINMDGSKSDYDHEALVADYSPEETDEIRHVVHPDLLKVDQTFMDKVLRTIFPYTFNVDKSKYELLWNNKANVQVETGIDHERYTNITSLGYTSGRAVNLLSQWIRTYNKTHDTFEPLELAIAGEGTVITSQICHDFITDALWVLYEDDSTTFDPENHVFRDHIVLYASEMEEVDSIHDDVDIWQDIVNYYEEIKRHMGIINIEFTYARTFFSLISIRGINSYIYKGTGGYDRGYSKFKLASPFINYCYMPLYMPPERADIFTSPRHCALPEKIEEGDTQHDALKYVDYWYILAGDDVQIQAASIIGGFLGLILLTFIARKIHSCRQNRMLLANSSSSVSDNIRKLKSKKKRE